MSLQPPLLEGHLLGVFSIPCCWVSRFLPCKHAAQLTYNKKNLNEEGEQGYYPLSPLLANLEEDSVQNVAPGSPASGCLHWIHPCTHKHLDNVFWFICRERKRIFLSLHNLSSITVLWKCFQSSHFFSFHTIQKLLVWWWGHWQWH